MHAARFALTASLFFLLDQSLFPLRSQLLSLALTISSSRFYFLLKFSTLIKIKLDLFSPQTNKVYLYATYSIESASLPFVCHWLRMELNKHGVFQISL